MAKNSDMFLNIGLKFNFERNTSTNTGDLENLHHKVTENSSKDAFTNLYNFFDFVFHIIHAWGAVDFRIFLSPKCYGYLTTDPSYAFFLHLAQLDNLDFTMSHIRIFLLTRKLMR